VRSSSPRTERLVALIALAGVAAALLRRGPLIRFAVEGPSMEPAYRHGERLLVNRLAYLRRPPAPGDVVVIRDPEHPFRLLLKRVAQAPDGPGVQPDGVYVLGDNAPQSRDSRQFGPVPRSAMVGKVWRRY
jgi:signal peptidase I